MHKKVLVPLVATPMLLASCKPLSFVGRYSFIMGKSNDSHIGIVLELTGEDYTENPSLGKKFSLTLDSEINKKEKALVNYTFEGEEGQGDESNTEVGEDDIPFDIFSGGDFSLSGYYSVGSTKNKDGYYNLALGARLIDPEQFDIIEVPDEIVSDIIIAEINSSSIKATIPVSITDLMYQLYWYGWDISIDIETFVIKIEKHSGETHNHGTHPTSDDIERINKTFPEDHFGLEFRDFDCLTMGLNKEK